MLYGISNLLLRFSIFVNVLPLNISKIGDFSVKYFVIGKKINDTKNSFSDRLKFQVSSRPSVSLPRLIMRQIKVF